MGDENLGSPAKIDELREKYEKDPGSKIFLQLAEEYRKISRFEDAIKVCLSGLQKNPGYTSARVTLARAYLGAKKTEEAKAEFEKVIAAVPDNILANRHLGDLYYEEGRLDDALKRYRVVQMLNPNDEEVVSRIGRIENGTAGTTGGFRSPLAPPAPVAAPAPPRTAASILPARPKPPAPAVAETDDEMAGFMDLKIDESVILNADMIAAALGSRPPEPARPASSAPAPASVAPPRPPPASAPLDDMGDMGSDDFSDFASPTVMLTAADLAKIPGVSDEPEAAPPAPPVAAAAPPPAPRPAPPVAEPRQSDFAARTAQKFGIGRYSPEAESPRPAPVPSPPAPKMPEAAAELPADDVGEMGMDDFSDFASPTVMMNVNDLLSSGVLGEGAAAPDAPPPPPAAPVEAASRELAGAPSVDAVGSAGHAPPAPEPWGEAQPALGVPAAASADDAFAAASAGSLPGTDPVPGEDEFAAAASFGDELAEPAFPASEPASAPPAESVEAFGTRAISIDDLPALRGRESAGAAPGDVLEAPAGDDPFAAPLPGGQNPFAEESPFAPLADAEPMAAEVAPAAARPPEASPLESDRIMAERYLAQDDVEMAITFFERHLRRSPGDVAVRAQVDLLRARLAPSPAAAAQARPEPAPARPAITEAVPPTPAHEPQPAPAAVPQAATAPAEEAEGESTDDRRKKIEKLSSWLSSLKKS